MSIESITRAALRTKLLFGDKSLSKKSHSKKSHSKKSAFKHSFSYVELLLAFGREGVNAEQAACLADRSGRSTAHQTARLDVLRAWCAFLRCGIEHDIGNADFVTVQMPDGSTFDEVRFSGHSMIELLMEQTLELCDDFGWAPPLLPSATAELFDSAKTLNCVATIEQWTEDKSNRPRSRPLSPKQIARIYQHDWRVVKGWIDKGSISAEALDSKNYRIDLADLPFGWESRLQS
jgi:hypothetical protein